MLTTRSFLSDMFSPWTELSINWKVIHALVWLLPAILFNIPAFEFTFGLFHSTDWSLLLPSVYGVFMNALLFYGNGRLVQLHLRKDPMVWVKLSGLLFVGVCLIEGVLDSAYFYIFYNTIRQDIVLEIIFGGFLLNGIFFYVPSFVFGFFLDWKMDERTGASEKIAIQDGHNKLYLQPNQLLYIESDGNYSVFYTENEKILERKSLTNLENELPSNFVRCHKSYIVNTGLVQKKSASELEIHGRKIPIGRTYKQQVMLLLG